MNQLSVFEQMQIEEKKQKLIETQKKLSNMASFQPIEFIYLVNAKVHGKSNIQKQKAKQADKSDEEMEEGEIRDDENDEQMGNDYNFMLSGTKQKQINQTKIIFQKSTAREFDYIVNKKMQSNALMLHEGRQAGKQDDRKIGRGNNFRQIVVNAETGQYRNDNIAKDIGEKRPPAKDQKREKRGQRP